MILENSSVFAKPKDSKQEEEEEKGLVNMTVSEIRKAAVIQSQKTRKLLGDKILSKVETSLARSLSPSKNVSVLNNSLMIQR